MGLARTVFDAAIGWTVQSILGSFFTGQRQDVAATLQPEMKSTQMVLAAAEGRRIDSRLLSELLKELFYGTEVVMDELNYYQFQKLIEGCIAAASINPEGSGVSSYCPSFFQRVSSSMNQITNWAIHGKKRKREEEPTHNIMLPLEIRNVISERINGIVNRLPIRGKSVQDVIGHNMASKHTRANSRRQTTSILTEPEVYGRDAEWQTIVELLIKGKSTALGVLSLVGVGGIGKTTLAQIVYHDQRIKDHFDLQMWICVSFGFNEQRLTIQMLDHVCEGRQGYKSFDVLQKKLLEKIRHKRFLLVLDDMWEDTNMRGWKNLLAPLTCNEATGCMILVTTRMTSVGKMVGTMSNVEVNGMDEPSIWEFFKSLAFRGTENQELDPSLVSIGKHIAKSLKGHPLAAKSIGGILNDSVCLEHYSPSLHSSPPMLTPGDKYTFNGPPRQVPQVPEEISEALHRNAKRAKKRKANPIVDDFHERYLSLTMEERDRIAAIKEKSEDPYCINKCIKTLENLQGLSMGDVLEAADIFTNNKTNRETFLSFSSDELRLGWLVRQIHHT